MIVEQDWPGWQGGGPGAGQLPTLSVSHLFETVVEDITGDILDLWDTLPPLFRFLIPKTPSQAARRIPWFVIVYLLYQAYDFYSDTQESAVPIQMLGDGMWIGPGFVQYA